MVPTAHERGIPIAICNAEPTAFDAIAEVVCRDRVENLLPRVVAAVAARTESTTATRNPSRPAPDR